MNGWPTEIWKHKRVWFLYDSTNGDIVLIRPYSKGEETPCPHCGKTLDIVTYRASCCNRVFRTGWHRTIRQQEPLGKHNKKIGRGWKSIRPFNESWQRP